MTLSCGCKYGYRLCADAQNLRLAAFQVFKALQAGIASEKEYSTAVFFYRWHFTAQERRNGGSNELTQEWTPETEAPH